MLYFEATNSTDMASKVYPYLERNGVKADSRNGKVLKFLSPVTTIYLEPWNRANFTPNRDANIFFHLAEAMWMLAGRRDVAFLDFFNSNMKNYSDDGEVFNAAYGYRARHEFGHDQLKEVVDILNKDPATRQAVIQLWDHNDLTANTLDKACNMLMVFSIEGVMLNLTVFNRSNDLVFGGVTGANPVHFSYFQQWVADRLHIPMGNLTFVSNNAHVYLDLYDHWENMEFYGEHPPRSIALPLGNLEEIEELCHLIDSRELINPTGYSLHLEHIIIPVMNCWIARKDKHPNYRKYLDLCLCPATRLACQFWLDQRDL